MNIDNNEKAKASQRAYEAGDNENGRRYLKEFLAEAKEQVKDHCSCTEPCFLHGKCMECVIAHRGHQDHLPKCFRPLVNERIEALSLLTEHSVKERL